MKTLDEWLVLYGRDHQNKTNKIIHWICVPVILYAVFGLLLSIPFPYIANGWINPATIVLTISIIFYANLSVPIAVGMFFIGFIMIWLNKWLQINVLPIVSITLWQFSLIIFVVAWIFQFIGHKIEGQKPSFFEDVQFLLIGPIWLLHYIYKKIGIPYK